MVDSIRPMSSRQAKPPLGLMPRKVWMEERLGEVCDAIDRYQKAGVAVPMEWYRELVSLSVNLGWGFE